MTFNKLSLAAFAALSMTAAAGQAFASPSDDAFNAFRAICGTAGTDFPAVVAAADAGGWKATQITADTMPNVSVTDKQARDKKVGEANLALFVTRGLMHSKAGDLTVTTCTLSSDKANGPALIALAQQWVGTPPHDTTPTKTGFRYSLNGADPAPAPVPAGGISAAVAAGGMVLMSVQTGGGKATLDIEKFKK